MAWTDERIEKLKERWAAGWSATQIAAKFGDVTRNSVIGKLHRLGATRSYAPKKTARRIILPEQVSDEWPIHKIERLSTLAREGLSASQIAGQIGTSRVAVLAKLRRMNIPLSRTFSAPKAAAKTPKPPVPMVETLDDLTIPFEQRKTLLQLSADTCRWPVGDPVDAGFFFCGGKPVEGLPYCSGHAMRAYGAGRARAPDCKEPELQHRRFNFGAEAA